VTGRTIADDIPVIGYEMHIGRTGGEGTGRPLVQLDDGRIDGAVSIDGRVAGTYLHGFFAADAQRAAWLARLGAPSSSLAYDALIEQTLDALAAHLEAHLDIDTLLGLAR
jgi:adenosylcobyric acid synthase